MRQWMKFGYLVSGSVLSVAFIAPAKAETITITDAALATSSGNWSMVCDASQPFTLNPTGTSTSKGLYSVNVPANLNFSWLSVPSNGGIQSIINHTGSTTAIAGLGTANTHIFDPLTIDAIAEIDLEIKARQTSTPNDSGMIAGLLIQGTNYYRTQWQTIKGATTLTLTWNDLGAASFGKFNIGAGTSDGTVNFGENPDFTATGLQFQLGYLAGYDPTLGTADALNRSIVNGWTAVVTTGTVRKPGDADEDGDVDSVDFGILAGNYGVLTGATWSMGDFDADAKVTTTDFNILAGNFGPGAASLGSVVPEPSSLALCMLGVGFLRRRRA